jgi:hypothetical protein
MSHEEAINKCQEYLYLIDKHFLNRHNEKETVKAVVPWEEEKGDWQPHVCFYNWPDTSQGVMSHMNLHEFIEKFSPETT